MERFEAFFLLILVLFLLGVVLLALALLRDHRGGGVPWWGLLRGIGVLIAYILLFGAFTGLMPMGNHGDDRPLVMLGAWGVGLCLWGGWLTWHCRPAWRSGLALAGLVVYSIFAFMVVSAALIGMSMFM